MNGNGACPSEADRRVVGFLRRASLLADVAGVVVVLSGRPDEATWVGLVSVVLRCAAEWREVTTRR